MIMRTRVASAIVLVASVAHADEYPYTGGPLPPNTHVERRRDQDVIEDGALTMAGFYVMSLFAGWIGDLACNGSCTDHAYDLVYLPLVGPAIAAALPGVQRESPAWSVILVADSTAQILGGAIALVAYLLPTKRVVVTNARATKPTWLAVPLVSHGAVGITISAAF